MDSDHIRLFSLADDLHAALGQNESKESVRERIAALIDHSRAHFVREEALMRQREYPGFEAHKEHHAHLIRIALEFQHDVVAGRVVLSAGMLQFLKDWLIPHIRQSDRLLAEFLKSQAVSVQNRPRAPQIP